MSDIVTKTEGIPHKITVPEYLKFTTTPSGKKKKKVFLPGNTDYSNICNYCYLAGGYTFGDSCIFPDHSRFGPGTVFGDGCGFGDRCEFGEGSSFGYYCAFGKQCTVDSNCNFKDGCAFGKLSWVKSQCTFGKYCSFDNQGEFFLSTFDQDCSFGTNSLFQSCHFNLPSSFGVECCLDDDCTVNGKAVIGNTVYTVEGISSYTVIGIPVKHTVIILFGGWTGTLGEFRKKVKNTKSEYFSMWNKEEMLLVADLIERRWKREKGIMV